MSALRCTLNAVTLLVDLLAAIPLVVFSIRRLVFAIVAMLTPILQAPASRRPLPDLLALIPCRNDGASLPPLIEALADQWLSARTAADPGHR